MPRIYLNGSFLEREEARLPIGDRGFFFADGIYEVTRVVRGRLFEEDADAVRVDQLDAAVTDHVFIDVGHTLDFMPIENGRPYRLDKIALYFPELTVVCTHTGWPWVEETLGVVTHKKNIFVDTSGYLAEQLPELFQKAIGTRLGLTVREDASGGASDGGNCSHAWGLSDASAGTSDGSSSDDATI